MVQQKEMLADLLASELHHVYVYDLSPLPYTAVGLSAEFLNDEEVPLLRADECGWSMDSGR